MKIENLSENYKLNINFSNNQPTASKKNNQRKNYALKTVAGVGIASVAFVGAGLISRGNFTKNVLKKGLEIKDGILINSKNGNRYTGKIKSNVGNIIGFNRVETRVFEDGIITEKTFKNMFGQEKEGYFYKDGKECLDVFIKSQNIKTKNKKISTTWRDKNNSICIDTDGYRKGSVFEWARNLVKEEGWFNSAKFQENLNKWKQNKK